jgi:hypothetical protein
LRDQYLDLSSMRSRINHFGTLDFVIPRPQFHCVPVAALFQLLGLLASMIIAAGWKAFESERLACRVDVVHTVKLHGRPFA